MNAAADPSLVPGSPVPGPVAPGSAAPHALARADRAGTSVAGPGAASPFLDVADRIGARFARDAVWAEGRCNWLGWSVEWDGRGWGPAYRAQGPLLYDGTAGIALFLAELVRFTGDPHQRAALDGALGHLRGALAGLPPSGYYAGLAGGVCVLLRAHALLGDERWLAAALAGLDRLAAAAPDPAHADVIGGSAGAIPTLLHAARRFGRADCLAAALAHGESLLAAASTADGASSWSAADGSRLIGYAHGAGGIACALHDLAAATGEERWRHACRSGLAYERRRFSARWRNWPDLRAVAAAARPGTSPPDAAGCPVAWCHGAPGVGFSRLRLREAGAGDSDTDAELEAAVETTREALRRPLAFGNGYCLCHGAAGQADFLVEAAAALGRPELREEAARVGRAGAAAFHETDIPWPSGIPAPGESLNLMLGTAGIGHFYLRLHAPDAVPTVLLQSPRDLAAAAPAGAPPPRRTRAPRGDATRRQPRRPLMDEP